MLFSLPLNKMGPLQKKAGPRKQPTKNPRHPVRANEKPHFLSRGQLDRPLRKGQMFSKMRASVAGSAWSYAWTWRWGKRVFSDQDVKRMWGRKNWNRKAWVRCMLILRLCLWYAITLLKESHIFGAIEYILIHITKKETGEAVFKFSLFCLTSKRFGSCEKLCKIFINISFFINSILVTVWRKYHIVFN